METFQFLIFQCKLIILVLIYLWADIYGSIIYHWYQEQDSPYRVYLKFENVEDIRVYYYLFKQ